MRYMHEGSLINMNDKNESIDNVWKHIFMLRRYVWLIYDSMGYSLEKEKRILFYILP